MSTLSTETLPTSTNCKNVTNTRLPSQSSEARTGMEESKSIEDSKARKASKPTNKSHKKLKDPEAPRRPLTPYMLFAKEERIKVINEMGKLATGDVGKEMGKRWGLMDQQERKKYEDAYMKDKARYVAEMKAYQPSQQFLDMKAKHDLAKREDDQHIEKYFSYVLANWRKISQESPSLGPKEVQEKAWAQWTRGDLAAGDNKCKKMKKVVDPEAPKKPASAFFLFQKKMRKGGLAITAKGLGEMWKNMNDDAKNVYKGEEDELKKKYLLEVEEYKKDKLSLGV